MRIYILGANGMLGNALIKEFAGEEIMVGDLPEADITQPEKLRLKLESFKPEAVINSAAFTDVDGCESNKAACDSVNGTAVGELAKICFDLNCLLVHYSTDYVFEGTTESGYREGDLPRPVNAYGQSKYLGEQLLRKYCQKHYLIRTSWLYGAGGKNFVNTVIELAKQEKELKIVGDQFGSPTYVKDLAKATRQLLQSKLDFGIYHRTNSNSCSWYELALKIREITGFDAEVREVLSKDFSRPANRPKYSRLINTKLAELRTWQEALREYLINLK